MNISQKIQEINSEQQKLNEKTILFIKEFEEYIQNQKISLLTRWTTFQEAPLILSHNLDSLPHFHYENLGNGLDFFMEELLTAEHIKALENSNNTLNLKNIIKRYISIGKNKITINLSLMKLYLENKDKYTDEEIKKYVFQMMEDILQLNLATFDYES